MEYQYDAASRQGNVIANYRLKPGSEDITIVIAKGIELGRKFSYEVRFSSAGYLNVSSQGYSWGKQISASWKNKPLYFKAGAYTLDNTGYKNEGAQVTFSLLEVAHTKP